MHDINSQGLKILTLIREKRKNNHRYHYNFLAKNIPLHV
jgi:hypothetical protein